MKCVQLFICIVGLFISCAMSIHCCVGAFTILAGRQDEYLSHLHDVTMLSSFMALFACLFIAAFIDLPFPKPDYNRVEIARRRELIKFAMPNQQDDAERELRDFIVACTPQVPFGSCRACPRCTRMVLKDGGCDTVRCRCGWSFDFESARVVDTRVS